jgi:hypothetical protein
VISLFRGARELNATARHPSPVTAAVISTSSARRAALAVSPDSACKVALSARASAFIRLLPVSTASFRRGLDTRRSRPSGEDQALVRLPEYGQRAVRRPYSGLGTYSPVSSPLASSRQAPLMKR